MVATERCWSSWLMHRCHSKSCRSSTHGIALHVSALCNSLHINRVQRGQGGNGQGSHTQTRGTSTATARFAQGKDSQKACAGRKAGGWQVDGRRTLKHVFEALLDELVRAAHEREAVDVVELGCDLGAEEPAGAPRRHSPRLYVLRVAPHEVAEGALVGNLTHPLYRPHLRSPTKHIFLSTCLLCMNCSPVGTHVLYLLPVQPSGATPEHNPPANEISSMIGTLHFHTQPELLPWSAATAEKYTSARELLWSSKRHTHLV